MGVTVSLSELLRLAHHAARGKKRSPDVAAFLLDPVPKLAVLQAELEDGSYHPGAARAFVIEEPKRRLMRGTGTRGVFVERSCRGWSGPAVGAIALTVVIGGPGASTWWSEQLFGRCDGHGPDTPGT